MQEIVQLLSSAAQRLSAKKLFGRPGDTLSMRIPGGDTWMWVTPQMTQAQSSKDSSLDSETALHEQIYKQRPDAGALLFSTTIWSEQLATLKKSPPTLFDEPARHIGPVAAPLRSGDHAGLMRAIKRRSNVAVYGSQLMRIGMTADRLVFNTELFEKCAMAFVIAHSSGQQIRTVPAWVRYIAGGRLHKDQKKAAECYDQGTIPEGMSAY